MFLGGVEMEEKRKNGTYLPGPKHVIFDKPYWMLIVLATIILYYLGVSIIFNAYELIMSIGIGFYGIAAILIVGGSVIYFWGIIIRILLILNIIALILYVVAITVGLPFLPFFLPFIITFLPFEMTGLFFQIAFMIYGFRKGFSENVIPVRMGLFPRSIIRAGFYFLCMGIFFGFVFGA